MLKIQFKNLPKGFDYPLTQREVRSVVEGTNADFKSIMFSGLASSERYYSKSRESNTHFVVYITAIPDDLSLGWHFTLEINGLKPERYEGRREEIAQSLLDRITKWIKGKLELPTTAPKKSSRASLSFNLTEKEIVALQEKFVFHPKSTAPDFLSEF